jgi:hypothetical protein
MKSLAPLVLVVFGLGPLACAGGAATQAGFAPDASDTDGEGADAGACASGATRTCNTCVTGQAGTQTCGAAGWGACDCVAIEAGSDGPAVCGDGVCNGSENCETCPVDCGQCQACSLAPSCTNGASLPTQLTPLPSLDCADTDGGVPRCGVGVDGGPPIQSTDCLAPQLKIGLADIRVVLNGVGGSLDMFCMISADDGHTSELVITTEQMGIGDHASAILVPTSQGTFWGQSVGTPKLSQFPLTINYQCYEVDSPSAWQSALGAISQTAGMVAMAPGNPYGWIFGAAAAGAAAAQAGLAAGNGISLRLNYQQTIDPSSFLEMTNGSTWSVEQSGQANGHNWDWALDMQSWGCSAQRPPGSP